MTRIALIAVIVFALLGGALGFYAFNQKEDTQVAASRAAAVPDEGSWHGTARQAPVQDIDFGPYMAEVQRKIKHAWFPPKTNESKRFIVVFKVHSDGSVTNIRLVSSSGIKVADQAGLSAVRNAAPFSPLPKGAPADVDIQFTFDYNVFKSKDKSAQVTDSQKAVKPD